MSQCRYPPQRMSVGSPAEEASPWGPRSRPVRFNRFPSHKPNCRFGIPTGGDAKVEDRPSLADRHLVVLKTQTEPSNWLDRVLVKGSRKPQSGPLSLLEGGTPGRISAVSRTKNYPAFTLVGYPRCNLFHTEQIILPVECGLRSIYSDRMRCT